MKKKVAIVYHYLALYRLPIFLELMKSTDVEYTIVSGLDSEIPIKKIDEAIGDLPLDKGGVRWVKLHNNWLLGKRFLWQKGLTRLVFKNEFDSYIFLGSPYYLSTWFAVLAARLKKKKVYYWMHGVYQDKLGVIDYIKLYFFYKMADGYFLYGNRAAEVLKKRNIKPQENIHVIYNSLDYASCLSIRREIGVNDILLFRKSKFQDDSLPTVVFIGRLNSIKKIDLLINAQAFLATHNGKVPFNILLIGDGEELDRLRKLSKILNLEAHILFAGAIYDEKEIGTILMHSDLCVTPGEVGLTAIHALSYGTPVISHGDLNIQMPEVEAIKKGISGDFYKKDDVNDLASVIEKWFSARPIKSKEVMKQCQSIIDQFYNPKYQASVFNKVLK